MKTFQWDSENIVRMQVRHLFALLFFFFFFLMRMSQQCAFQLWDIAGQERFGNMTRVYYKEASAAFIVLATLNCIYSHTNSFDVNRATSWNAVINWKNDIDSKARLFYVFLVNCVRLQKDQKIFQFLFSYLQTNVTLRSGKNLIVLQLKNSINLWQIIILLDGKFSSSSLC